MLKILIPLAAGLGLVFWAARAAIAVAVCVIVLAYFVSLYAHPNRQCASCGGGKRHRIGESKNSRHCWTCGGRGEYPRLGVKLFRRDVTKGLAAGKHGRNW